MHASRISLAFMALLGLSAATPTPVNIAPRCGSTIYPTILQQLNENSPATVGDNTASTTGDFHVSQGNGSTSRIYQIVAFQAIPAGSYGCQLNVQFPANYTVVSIGDAITNVTTLFTDSPSSITYPNNWSWSTFFPPTSPPLGQGLFGTTRFSAGQSAAINSEACPASGDSLAFLFSIASWVPGAASVDFIESNRLNGRGGAGVYLTFGC